MTFVIDADILGILQRAEALAPIQSLGRLSWVITDEVWYELTDRAAANGAYPATVDDMRKFLAAVAGERTVIAPMTPEAESLALLSSPPVKEDPGELSVIAYSFHHPEVTAIVGPITAMVGLMLAGSAITSYAARRGDAGLRAMATGRTIAFVLLTLASIGIFSQLATATSLGNALAIVAFAALAAIAGLVVLAGLLGRTAEAIEADAGLPPARIL
jgi:hypothetical protein